METVLKEINAVLGVIGAFVCLPDGGLAAAAMPNGFESTRLAMAAQVASQTFNSLETSGQRIVEMDLLFDQNRLVLKNLRGGVLSILCVRNINLPLLNLTANVAAKKIAAELKPPQAAHAPRRASAAAPESAASRDSKAALPSPAQVTPAEHTVSLSEPVDAQFLDQLTREFARVIGPPARLIIEDEIGALKETRDKFPKARVAELVERIGETIHDDAKRTRFHQAMQEAIRKL